MNNGTPPKLRVGIIGLGRAGASMVPGIAAHPRVKFTAASDLRREALEKFAVEFEAEIRAAMAGVTDPAQEAALKASTGYGGARQRGGQSGAEHHPHFGVTIASCQRGDLRPSADGVLVYSGGEKREIPLPVQDREARVLDELIGAIEDNHPVIRDGRGGKATLDVCPAILPSSRERREIYVQHQVPVADTAIDAALA